MEMGKCSQGRGPAGVAGPPVFLWGLPRPTGWPQPSTSTDRFLRGELGCGWTESGLLESQPSLWVAVSCSVTVCV